MAQRTAGWRYLELPASHHPAVAMPDEVASLLLDVAS
jgi:hypothetical protein